MNTNQYNIQAQRQDAIDDYYNEDFKTPNLIYCSYFGCGKQLTMQEQLLGDRCENHQEKKYVPLYVADKYISL